MKLRRRLGWSMAIAALMAGLPVIQRTLLVPAYYHPENQWWISGVSRICSLLLLPGKTLVYQVAPPQDHYFETGPLVVAACINFMGLAAGLFALFTAFAAARKGPIDSVSGMPADAAGVFDQTAVSRRQFLRTTALSGAGLLTVGAAGYPVLLRPNWLKVREVEVPIYGLPKTFSGLRIVQLTDLHHDEWISIDLIKSAIDLARDLRADVYALTGDYVTANRDLVRPVAQHLGRLDATIGTVAVLGNHDWWAGADLTRGELAAVGISVIDNSRVFVDADRRLGTIAGTGGICLAGVGDLWEDTVDLDAALADVPPAMPRILLSHNPDIAEQSSVKSRHHRVDLIVSGHTHGGQVRLPFIGTPVVPSDYGQKYAHGLVKGPACPVHICAGIGMALLPVRFGVPPEIAVIRLVPA